MVSCTLQSLAEDLNRAQQQKVAAESTAAQLKAALQEAQSNAARFRQVYILPAALHGVIEAATIWFPPELSPQHTILG